LSDGDGPGRESLDDPDELSDEPLGGTCASSSRSPVAELPVGYVPRVEDARDIHRCTAVESKVVVEEEVVGMIVQRVTRKPCQLVRGTEIELQKGTEDGVGGLVGRDQPAALEGVHRGVAEARTALKTGEKLAETAEDGAFEEERGLSQREDAFVAEGTENSLDLR
jgi:hypothetical protein